MKRQKKMSMEGQTDSDMASDTEIDGITAGIEIY